jgi:hypothetical protein
MIFSDASYLNEENARSRTGGHHFLSKNVSIAEIIKAIMSSAAESECGSIYINAQKGGRRKKHPTRDGTSTTPQLPSKQTTQWLM